jgi:triphosphoribosyl-dephospho-CoA synthase
MAVIQLFWENLKRQIAQAYRQACLSELEALKPGNVHRFADGHGMNLVDFVASADASVEPLTDSAFGLGERIFHAVKATREAVGCNTNLGILMLCAPLILAMLDHNKSTGTLQERMNAVLNQANKADTEWLFRAIQVAAPGGLGQSDKYDVYEKPSASLLEVMSHASDRDLIARQYTTGYQDIFEFALPTFMHFLERWQNREWAITALYLSLLARYPDTHVERKFGLYKAVVTTLRAGELLRGLEKADRPEDFQSRLMQADKEFKQGGINPGTTADLTVATLFVSHLEPVLSQFEQNTGLPRVRDSRPSEVGIQNQTLNNK